MSLPEYFPPLNRHAQLQVLAERLGIAPLQSCRELEVAIESEFPTIYEKFNTYTGLIKKINDLLSEYDGKSETFKKYIDLVEPMLTAKQEFTNSLP